MSTDRVVAMQAAAVCLDYPDERWSAHLPLLAQVADRLSGRAGVALAAFHGWAGATPPGQRARHYVETFDLRRRCCLYLTYYAFGDTRNRGVALLRFTQAYRGAGFAVASEELPDHLAVVCEFAARVPEPGLALLQEHRAGLELLHLALTESSSPYADVVEVVRAVLPDPAPRDLQRALDLARSGPPAEDVGLEPFPTATPSVPGRSPLAPPGTFGARR